MKLKTNWNTVTLNEFQQIEQIMKADISPDYKAVNLLSVLSGEKAEVFENMPLTQFTELCEYIMFVTEGLPTDALPKKKYIINGHEYYLSAQIPEITTSQYIDYTNYMNEEKVDIAKLISVFIIPKGHTYNDGYDINTVIKDAGDMFIKDATALAFFFAKQYKLFKEILKFYLQSRIKKMKKKLKDFPEVQEQMDYLSLELSHLS